MKSAAFCLACISSMLLFSTPPGYAVEKKSVFNTESMKYESGTGVERCRDKCGRRSGPDVKSLLAEGWIIESSSPREVIAEKYWHVPCNTCLPHGCVCIGTEYVLRKDGPAPKDEAKGTVSHARVEDDRPLLQPQRAENPGDASESLKKEIDMLKQENALLKQENETLRNQLRSKRK